MINVCRNDFSGKLFRLTYHKFNLVPGRLYRGYSVTTFHGFIVVKLHPAMRFDRFMFLHPQRRRTMRYRWNFTAVTLQFGKFVLQLTQCILTWNFIVRNEAIISHSASTAKSQQRCNTLH